MLLLKYLLAFVLLPALTHGDIKEVKDASIGGLFRNVFRKVVTTVLPSKTRLTSLVMTAGTCTVSKDKGWYSEELGNFTMGSDSPYCDSSCSRSAVCCAPQKPDEVQVKFFHFDKRNQSSTLNLTSSESAHLVQQNPHLVWFIHGFADNMFKNPVFNQTRDAYLRRGFDVVQVDWSGGNLEYFQALANIRLVAALTGRMIKNYGVAATSTCVGFSLGSHVCGEVGSWIKQRGETLSRCIGIDPAGPAFDGCSNTVRLDKGDCQLVTSIHTSQFKGIRSLIDNEGLGTTEKVGHCDFWANDGKDQPKCQSNLLTKSCSHARGMDYFLSQVRKRCNFIGHEAECGEGENCERIKRADSESAEEAFHPTGGWRRAANHVDHFGHKLLPKMPISPDDLCTPDYDTDYQFDTKAKEPYC